MNLTVNGAVVGKYDKDHWERQFEAEDPWGYDSAYEIEKADRTLSLLPEGPIARAAEIACAEGHFTFRLAPLVGTLLASDISDAALARAAQRCSGKKNVSFARLDFQRDELPIQLDLLVCGEALYYVKADELTQLAIRFADTLNDGGRILLTHGIQLSDDPTRTGFDWGHEFGGEKIGQVFRNVPGLYLERELRTPLYLVQLFRRREASEEAAPPTYSRAEILAPIPAIVEREIVWGGAKLTQSVAKANYVSCEVPILAYHGISDEGPEELASYRTSPAAFEEQMRLLRSNGFHTISLAECFEHLRDRLPFPGRPMIITFDDGYQDFADAAWPVLNRCGFTATVFIVTEKVGDRADWDTELTDPPRLMGWDTIRLLANAGVEFGNHTANHRNLSESPDGVIVEEWTVARDKLAAEIGQNAPPLAFPYGRTDPRCRRVLQEAGCEVAVTTFGGVCTLLHSPLDLPRIEVLGTDALLDFEAKALCAEPRLVKSSKLPDERSAEILSTKGDVKMPINPQHASALSARVDRLIGEFVSLQTELLSAASPRPAIESKLASLFCQPVTGPLSRRLKPYERISPSVRIGFQEPAEMNYAVIPKSEFGASPTNTINTLEFRFSGESRWLSIEIDLAWSDIAHRNGNRFAVTLIR